MPPSACNASQSTVICTSPSATRSQTARSERAIRRWISWVRPDCLPLAASREARSGVEPGSMEYSAVTQPLPLPRIHGGTRSSTDAVHSTLVCAEGHQHRPGRHHRVVALELHRPQLVDGSPVLPRRPGVPAHVVSSPLHSSRGPPDRHRSRSDTVGRLSCRGRRPRGYGVGRDLEGGVDVAIGLEFDDVAAGVGDLGLGLLGGLPFVIGGDRDRPTRRRAPSRRVTTASKSARPRVTPKCREPPGVESSRLVGTILQRHLHAEEPDVGEAGRVRADWQPSVCT